MRTVLRFILRLVLYSILVVVGLIISGLAFLVISAMIMNHIDSKKYEHDVQNWIAENGMNPKEAKRDYGNLLWNGNKCMTAIMVKVPPGIDQTALRLKINDSLFQDWPQSNIMMAENDFYVKNEGGYLDGGSGKEIKGGEAIGDLVDLPIRQYGDSWKTGETVLVFSLTDYSEWATWDPYCQ